MHHRAPHHQLLSDIECCARAWRDGARLLRVHHKHAHTQEAISHSCECFVHVPGTHATSGTCMQVGKGQLGEVVDMVKVPAADFEQWLSTNVQPGATGCVCEYQMHTFVL